MKHLKRFSVIILIAMLCAMTPAISAEDNIDIIDDAELADLEGQELTLEVAEEAPGDLLLDEIDELQLPDDLMLEGDASQTANDATYSPAPITNDAGDFVIDENGTLTAYNGTGGDVVIPSGVSQIASGAFSSNTDIVSVYIPGTVQSVGQQAFSACIGLKKVVIEDGVLSLGQKAFSGCFSLSDVQFPASLTSIGSNVFYGCVILEITAHPSLARQLARENSALVAWHVPEGVTEIAKKAFFNCGKLASITLPKTVTSIGDDAFAYCKSLFDIVLPESVTTIGSYAFSNCTNLRSVIMGNGLQSIGDSAFVYCTSLESVEFPSAVSTLGRSVFKGCSTIRSIVIPNGVTEMRLWLFCDCTSLDSVTIPASVTEISTSAFQGCNKSQLVLYTPCETVATAQARKTGFTVVASDHQPVVVPGVEPTCTQTGLTEGSRCAVCDNVIDAQQTIAMLPHQLVIDPGIEATCTEPGLTEGSHCSVCGNVVDAQQTIPAKGHTVVIDPPVAPTESATGLTEGSHCSVCGVIIVEQKVVPKLILPQKVKLNVKGTQKLVIGKKKTLKATIIPGNADTKKELTWKSSNKKVVTVNSKGVVKAVGKGTAKITATTTNGKSASVRFKVSAPVPTKVTLNAKRLEMEKNETFQLKATLKPAKAESKLKWTSSNKAVATVSKNGLVTARKVGKAIITVTTANGKAAKVTVVVEPVYD